MKSLELRWIKGFDKSLWLPPVIFVLPMKEGGAYYVRPQKTELLVEDGKYYSLDYGLIVCGEEGNTRWTANSLAHEWRHHWQVFNIGRYGPIFPAPDWETDYKESIIKYFSSSCREMDALKFSHKVAPCDASAAWLEWLT